MPTWPAVAVTLALFALCLSSTRLGPGWRAWPRGDRINYIVLCVAVWPYLLVGFITTPPLWYTVLAGAVFAVTLAVFMIRQVRFLREGRAIIAHAEAQAAILRRAETDRPDAG